MALVAAAAVAADWLPTLPATSLAVVFAAELFWVELLMAALFGAALFNVELFNVELFCAEPLTVGLVLAAGFAVIGLDFSGLGLAELPEPAPELAMLAAVAAAAVEAIVAFLAGPVSVAVGVAVVAAVFAADWPAAAMGTELDLAVIGLPGIAPPVVLIATGLLVGLLVWPWPKAGLVVPGLGVTQGLLVGAAGKD